MDRTGYDAIRFAAQRSCLANTSSRSRGWRRPRFALHGPPSAIRGRGECRVPNAPAEAWCAHIGSEYAHQYSQRKHRKHPASPTQWFYGLLRALPGDHRFVDPVIRATRWRLANLTPASGRQNHTASPSASNALVSRAARVHRIPPNVRDDRDTPLLARRDGESKAYDSEKRKQNIFRGRVDRISRPRPTGKSPDAG